MKKIKEVVVIIDMSAGNESVGEMWQETKLFDPQMPIYTILEWAMKEGDTHTRKRITLTVPHQ